MREIHRRKSFKTVRFIQSVGGAGIECQMVDMHSEGARLRFQKLTPNCGREVEIMILPELVPVKATVTWRTLQEMGIKFRKPLEYLKRSDLPAAPFNA